MMFNVGSITIHNESFLIIFSFPKKEGLFLAYRPNLMTFFVLFSIKIILGVVPSSL